MPFVTKLFEFLFIFRAYSEPTHTGGGSSEQARLMSLFNEAFQKIRKTWQRPRSLELLRNTKQCNELSIDSLHSVL